MKAKKSSTAFEWIDSVALALVAVIVLFTFVCQMYTVVGTSMEPTLYSEQRVLIWSALYQPKSGDIVVVDNHIDYGKTLVKRVIAVGGQTVTIDGETGGVLVDGVSAGASLDNIRGDTVYPLTVPEGYCFVMGDHRGVSLDSRYQQIGLVPCSHITGRVLLRLYPFTLFE